MTYMTDLEAVFIGLHAHVEQQAAALDDPRTSELDKARIKRELRQLLLALLAFEWSMHRD